MLGYYAIHKSDGRQGLVKTKADKTVFEEISGSLEGAVSVEGMRLYIVTEEGSFDELDDDDETVEQCKIKDGDKLHLLLYRWVDQECNVTLRKAKSKVKGVELENTCLSIKLRPQDQLGVPVSSLRVLYGFRWVMDDEKPFTLEENASIVLVTEEDFQEVEKETQEFLVQYRGHLGMHYQGNPLQGN